MARGSPAVRAGTMAAAVLTLSVGTFGHLWTSTIIGRAVQAPVSDMTLSVTLTTHSVHRANCSGSTESGGNGGNGGWFGGGAGDRGEDNNQDGGCSTNGKDGENGITSWFNQLIEKVKSWFQ